MYEITRLIDHVINGKVTKKREVIEKLGYKDDIHRGYSRLEGLLQTGTCSTEIREELASALGIDKRFVEDAFNKTGEKLIRQQEIMRIQREELQEKRFSPYIWIEHEYDRLMTGTNIDTERYEAIKKIELPDNISTLQWEGQIKIIKDFISINQKRNNSKIFGNAICYIYFKNICDSFLFDTYGYLMNVLSTCEQDLKYAVN